ncbi:MAG: MarR family transcriptional regulator [Clostridiales Family XIII bacterium]|jgi:DNA-binding MarR family transcriptional regulator|nr:MarR family transcriptional regulator [Clostridiales Family XIII bacterium]
MNNKEKNSLKTDALRALFRFRNVAFISHRHGITLGSRGQKKGQYELNMAEFLFIRTLAERGDLEPDKRLGGLKEMTKSLYISKAAMSQMTKSMTKRGLITSERNPHDERSLIYHLTPQGKEVLGGADGGFDGVFEKVLGEFGWDETEHLIGEIDRLADIIDDIARTRESALKKERP